VVGGSDVSTLHRESNVTNVLAEEEISRMSLTETLASQRIDIGSVSVFLQLGGVYWLKRGHGYVDVEASP